MAVSRFTMDWSVSKLDVLWTLVGEALGIWLATKSPSPKTEVSQRAERAWTGTLALCLLLLLPASAILVGLARSVLGTLLVAAGTFLS